MMATKTTRVLAIAILLSFTTPIMVFAEDEKSDHHDDKNKHQRDEKLYCHLLDHDDNNRHRDEGDHDNQKHDDDEKHSA
jgi:hypothetical protein